MNRTRLSAILAGTLSLATIVPSLSATAVAPLEPLSAQSASKVDASKVGPDFITGVDGQHDRTDATVLPARLRPPLQAERQQLRRAARDVIPMDAHARPSMAVVRQRSAATIAPSGLPTAAGCSTASFASAKGSALVAQVKGSTTDCVNTLFAASGKDATAIFNESQMVAVANALRSVSAGYTGDNSDSAAQLVLFLRAGYYAHYHDTATVGTYGTALSTAIKGALDAFFASSHAFDVTDANGETLSEAVTLIDSSEQNVRYLSVVKRLLNGYNASYNASWWMLNAVNNTYTVLFRGHQMPAFVSAVAADHSVLNTLYTFASKHKNLLGGQQSYLASNAGRELGRFLGDAAVRSTAKPLVVNLLKRSSITGPTAALWVGLAEMTDSFDKGACADYKACNPSGRLISSVLTVNYTCSSSIRILAQEMTSAQLSNSCASLRAQDSYFHSVVRDNGPVANDYNTTIEVVVFDSSYDYQTYAGAMYGIDTNNGGMYLEGNPAASGNQPRFIAYEAEWVRPAFQVWNLNHEYTHYLDGRFDMYGDFGVGVSTPTIWWIEGFAEYISYSYRGEAYTAAMTQAGYQTYSLRTLFDTTYSNDQTRIYNWGYLASRFMLTRHPNEMATVLGYYRTGNWNAARTYLTSSIGTRYDGEFRTFLAACASGDCGGSTTPTPTPTTTSTPTPTTTPTTPTSECTDPDLRALGRNCSRSNRSATAGNADYLFVYIPAGTPRLTITTSGGTGNANLYYSSTSWATSTNYTQQSANAGNAETIVINNPSAGYNYISLSGTSAFSGVSVATSF